MPTSNQNQPDQPTMPTSTVTFREMLEGANEIASRSYDPSWEELLNMSIEEQAEYADLVSKNHAANANFCAKGQTNTERDGQRFVSWNRTTLANCAYMAVHGNAMYKNFYRTQHNEFINWKLTHDSPEDSVNSHILNEALSFILRL